MSKLEYTIRDGREDDCVHILKMIRGLAIAENMEDQCEMTVETLKQDGFGPDKLYHCLVSESSSGEIIGYSIFVYTFNSCSGEKELYIEDIYVEPNFRRHGIAMRFIEEVSKRALENNCKRGALACLSWNEPAMNLYKKLDMVDSTEEFGLNFYQFERDTINRFSNSKQE